MSLTKGISTRHLWYNKMRPAKSDSKTSDRVGEEDYGSIVNQNLQVAKTLKCGSPRVKPVLPSVLSTRTVGSSLNVKCCIKVINRSKVDIPARGSPRHRRRPEEEVKSRTHTLAYDAPVIQAELTVYSNTNRGGRVLGDTCNSGWRLQSARVIRRYLGKGEWEEIGNKGYKSGAGTAEQEEV